MSLDDQLNTYIRKEVEEQLKTRMRDFERRIQMKFQRRKEYFTYGEVQHRLGLTRYTVIRNCKNGRFKVNTTINQNQPLIHASSIDKFIEVEEKNFY